MGFDLAPESGDAEAGVRRQVCESAAAEIGRGRGGDGVERGVEVRWRWYLLEYLITFNENFVNPIRPADVGEL